MSVELNTEARIPWPFSAHLGDGVMAPGGDLKSPAVPPFEATPGASRGYRVHVTEIASASDLDESVHVEAAGQFHTSAISGSARAELERSVAVGDRARTVLYEIVAEWDPALGPRDLALTAAAERELAAGPETFREKYGDYVVAGYTKEARLSVLARLRSSDTTKVTKAAAEAKAAFQSAGTDFDAAAAARTSATLATLETELELDVRMTGMANRSMPAFGLAIDDLPAYVADFRAHAVGARAAAVLVHLSRVDPRVPSSVPLDLDVYEAAEQLDRDLFAARQLLADLPPSQPGWADQLTAIRSRIEHGIPRDLDCTLDHLVPMREQLDAWVRDAEHTAAKLALWRWLRRDPEHADLGGRRRFRGVVGAQGRPLPVEALPPIHMHLDWKAGYEGHTDGRVVVDKAGARVVVRRGGADWDSPTPVAIPEHAGKKVVGYRCTSGRTANLGTLSVDQGDLLSEEIGFRAHSDYDRGFDWDVELWVAPADELAFAESDA